MSRLPWWMKNAAPEEKRLYFANCPHQLWPVELEDLPTPTPILHGKGKREVRITIKEQRDWMQRIVKRMRHPMKVLIVSGPTDLPGLALMTWWCKHAEMHLLDLGDLPDDKQDIPDTAIGLYNMLECASPDRIQAARDLLYRLKDRFVALCVSGPSDPIAYAYEVIRFYKFAAVFHLEGTVAIDRGRSK